MERTFRPLRPAVPSVRVVGTALSVLLAGACGRSATIGGSAVVVSDSAGVVLVDNSTGPDGCSEIAIQESAQSGPGSPQGDPR